MSINAKNANSKQRLCKRPMILLWKPAKNAGANSRKPFPIPLSISMEMAFTVPITSVNI
jgi:hypothetical protein